MTVLARALLAALAVVCATVAFTAHRSDTRCSRTVAEARQVDRSTVAAEGRGLARAVLARCEGAREAVVVALLLNGNGGRTDALVVARALVRREPGDGLGWFLLGGLERGRAAEVALARAKALNPTVGQQRSP